MNDRDLVAQLIAEEDARNAATVLDSKPPEQQAQIFDLAKRTRLPVGAVEQDPDYARREIERSNLTAFGLDAPKAADWATQPRHYDLVKDDLSPLAEFERSMAGVHGQGYGSPSNPVTKQIGYTDEDAYRMAPQGAWVQMADGSLRKREASLKDLALQFPTRIANVAGASIDAIGTFVDPIAQGLEDITGISKGGGASKAVADTLRAPSQGKGSNVYQPDVSFQDVKKDPLKFPEFFAEGTVQSAPDMLGVMANLPLYALGRDREIAEQRAKNNGRTTVTIGDQTFALPAAVIESTFERFATARLGTGSAGGSALARIGKETAIQGGTEFVEESTANLGETLGTDKGANLSDTLDAGLAGVLIGGPLGTVTQGSQEVIRAADRSATGLIRKAMEVAEAKDDKALLDNLVNIADSTKIKKLARDKFEELVKSYGEKTVYVPVEQLQTYFQGAGLDPAQSVSELTDSATAYGEALATGGEVAIPLENYIARVGADAHKVLGEVARLKVGQSVKPNMEMPTRAEFESDIQAAIQEATAKPERTQDDAAPVYDAIYGQLLGQVDKFAANQYASVAQSFYRTMGQRVGASPLELYNQFTINIPNAVQAKKQKDKVDLAYDPLLDALRSGVAFGDADVKDSPERARFADDLNAMGELLDASGIDVKTMNNAEIKALLMGETLNQPADGAKPDKPRGSISIKKNADGIEFDIRLLKGADFSTFLHETGHAYLEIFQGLASRENAPADIKADWQKILDYLGVADGATLTVDQHEKWARSFEAYLREGKTPSPSLRGIFASFKLWLSRIYKTARQLDVELTDDVRRVMDRMLASDTEIQAAQDAQNLGALFTDGEAIGMSKAEGQAYQKLVEAAKAEAENEVAAKVLAAEQRANAAWFRDETRKSEADIADELSREPVYAAQSILRNGKYGNGDVAPEGVQVHLDKTELFDKYGPEFLKRLKGLYRNEGGVSSDEAAVLFGFSNGGELIKSLVNAGPFRQVVQQEAKARMLEKYPDPLQDGTLPQLAMQAVHSDKQAEVLVKEINILEKRSNTRLTTLQVMKEAAVRIVSEKRLKDIQPNGYRLAEQKAGREAIEAALKQDWNGARTARRKQLLNHQLYRAAIDAQEATKKQRDYLRRFIDKDKRAQIGKISEEFLKTIDDLLAPVDWRQGITKDVGRGQPYRELTPVEIKDIHDNVKSTYYLAKHEGEIRLGDEWRNINEVADKMAASILENNDIKPTRYGLLNTGQKVAREWKTVRALAGAATDIARELDGYKDGGSVWDNTIRVVHEAVNNKLNPALKKAQEAEAEIYLRHYNKKELRDMARVGLTFEGVPGVWSHEQVLALALNWGNEGNRTAILSQAQKQLTPAQVGMMLSSLDTRDWAFARDVWAMIDTHWPELSDVAQKRTGLRPAKVEASPFTVVTKDGQTLTIGGGYYPLKSEADSRKAQKREDDKYYDDIQAGGFVKASTKAGATIERVGFGGATVRLDLGVISQHQQEVLRDIHLGDTVNYVHKMLNTPQMSDAVQQTEMLDNVKALEMWLKDVTTGELAIRSVGEKVTRSIRTNFTASALTYKPVSAALQLTGFVQSGVVVGRANMLYGIRRFAQNPSRSIKYVKSVSTFMESRDASHVDAIQDVMNAKASAFTVGKSAMIRWGYFMIGRVQQIVDVSTWIAAEKKGIEQFGDDRAKVIAYADDAVKRSQGSGSFEDKTPLQRGTLSDNMRQSEYIRATTALMGYMIAKNNVFIEQVTKAKRIGGIKGAAKIATNLMELFVIESIITAMIRGKLPEDEDDDGVSEEMTQFAFKEGFFGLLSGFPLLSTFGTELRGYDAKGVIANASQAVVTGINQTWQIGKKAYAGEDWQAELDKALLKSYVASAGVAAGVPSGQINKTIDAIAAKQDGKDVALSEYLTGPAKD
jgi:hypothetical protein